MTSLRLFSARPLVIAALHLPDFGRLRDKSMAWLEDYVVTNARVFAQAGIPYVKLQDQTREAGAMQPSSLAMTAALGRLLKAELPGLGLGIIVEAHDPVASLSIAHAAGADFVRLKVFVGQAMTAQGLRSGMGAQALAFRTALGRDDIAILADVHDRTAVPMSSETAEFAAEWAQKTGADGLILTGADWADSLARIRKARETGIKRPILLGGSVTEGNVREALSICDGVVVSTALMRKDAAPTDILRWDVDRARRFMDAARAGA
ncbi:BtpA/SgcQ family protein [Bosea sp. UNC402CLCol]|uniref:BtpA/SgcQ family protein n=1 Tax=Bosea sp. UNC402CLCol TaxID=1510531 RepID=UPI000AC415E5|nr:BtpA/SgcQ family protein [Bosea sp. UNC402CLCol]